MKLFKNNLDSCKYWFILKAEAYHSLDVDRICEVGVVRPAFFIDFLFWFELDTATLNTEAERNRT